MRGTPTRAPYSTARHLAWEGLAHGPKPQRFRIKIKTQSNRTAFVVWPHGTLLCQRSEEVSLPYDCKRVGRYSQWILNRFSVNR